MYEFQHCINNAILYAEQYIPSLLLMYQKLIESVNEIIHDLIYLKNPNGVIPESLPQNSKAILIDNPVERQKRIHQRTGQLVQINSALSYLLSQAFSGVVPILSNECPLKSYSLLGIGTAFIALHVFSRFVESIFEKNPIDEIIKNSYVRMPGFEAFNSLQNFDPDLWKQRTELTLDSLLQDGLIVEPNPKMVFYSGRLGFKESEFSVTSAIQVLSASDSVRWSMITLSHELMHAHVRAVLSVIFSDIKERTPDIAFAEYYHQFVDFLSNPHKQAWNRIECLRFVIFNYCRNKHNIDKFIRTNQGNPKGILKDDDHNLIRTESILHNADYLWEDFAHDFREINEIVVHVLDYHYFYNANNSIYLSLLWDSWETVPVVLEQIDHYVLRCIVTISTNETGTNHERFSISLSILKEALETISNNNPGNIAVKEAVKHLDDDGNVKILKYKFIYGLYLAEMVIKFLKSSKIHSELFGNDENIDINDNEYRYNLSSGEFPGFNVKCPVAFILDRLQKAQKKEDNILTEDHSSTWLFLACASAIDTIGGN